QRQQRKLRVMAVSLVGIVPITQHGTIGGSGAETIPQRGNKRPGRMMSLPAEAVRPLLVLAICGGVFRYGRAMPLVAARLRSCVIFFSVSSALRRDMWLVSTL